MSIYNPFQVNNAFLSRFAMSEEEMPGPEANLLVQDHFLLAGPPALNLASLATTFMDGNAEGLLLKNLVCSQFLLFISAVADFEDR